MIHGAQATQYIVSALLDLRISISSYTHHGLHVASIQVFSYFLVGLLSGVERENLIVLNNVVILQFHISIHLWSDYKFMMTFNLLWDTCLLHVNANVLNASKLNLPNWSNIFNSWFQFAIVNLLKLLMLKSIGWMIPWYLHASLHVDPHSRRACRHVYLNSPSSWSPLHNILICSPQLLRMFEIFIKAKHLPFPDKFAYFCDLGLCGYNMIVEASKWVMCRVFMSTCSVCVVGLMFLDQCWGDGGEECVVRALRKHKHIVHFGSSKWNKAYIHTIWQAFHKV